MSADPDPVPDLAARRIARTAGELVRDLPLAGSVVRSAEAWPGSAEQWRAAAGCAAESLRRPVRCGVSTPSGAVWAAITDWPRTADELARAAARFRALGG